MFNGFQWAIGPNVTCATMLFPSWVLATRTKYALGVLCALLLAMSVEGFAVIRDMLSKRLDRSLSRSPNESENPFLAEPKPRLSMHHRLPLHYRLVLALCYVLHMALGYCVMLLVMMFETSFFLAVLTGVGLGHVLFQSTDRSAQHVDPCCAHG